MMQSVRAARERQAIELADAYAGKWIRRGVGNQTVTVEEIRSAAYYGAAQALDTFDETRGTQFVTHCVPRVTGAIKDFFREIDPLTRGWRARFRAGEELPMEQLPPLSLETFLLSEDEWWEPVAEDSSKMVLTRIHEEELREMIHGLPDTRAAEMLAAWIWGEVPIGHSADRIQLPRSTAYRDVARACADLRPLLAARGYGPEG